MPIIIKPPPLSLSLSPETTGQQTAKAPELCLYVNVDPVSLHVGIYLHTIGTGSSFASGYISVLSEWGSRKPRMIPNPLYSTSALHAFMYLDPKVKFQFLCLTSGVPILQLILP